MNQIVLIGRLTADPVLEKTDSGVSKCKFSLAVQDGATNKNGEKEVDFINSIAWRSTAEFISKYFKKGSLIGVIGKLKVRPYENCYSELSTLFDKYPTKTKVVRKYIKRH